jgi:hypothetical protein
LLTSGKFPNNSYEAEGIFGHPQCQWLWIVNWFSRGLLKIIMIHNFIGCFSFQWK